jgi:hypothetical protein
MRKHTSRDRRTIVALYENKPPTKAQATAHAKRERQEAIEIKHRDLSTDEIQARVAHHQTLIALYEAQRGRNQQLVTDASLDIKACDLTLDELRNDVATLNSIVKARRC